MSDWTNSAKSSLDLLGSSLRGLELIGKMAKLKLATGKGDEALAALAIIANLVELVRQGFERRIDGGDLERHIQLQEDILMSGLASAAAATRDAIDKKFGPGE